MNYVHPLFYIWSQGGMVHGNYKNDWITVIARGVLQSHSLEAVVLIYLCLLIWCIYLVITVVVILKQTSRAGPSEFTAEEWFLTSSHCIWLWHCGHDVICGNHSYRCMYMQNPNHHLQLKRWQHVNSVHILNNTLNFLEMWQIWKTIQIKFGSTCIHI